MKSKTQMLAIATCLAVASIQFISCKKDAVKNGTAKAVSSTQNVIDTSVNLDSGLVAWYPFNGDLRDHSGHNNNVVFNSGTRVAGKDGLPKTAIKFEQGEYMTVNNSYSLNNNRITLYAVFQSKGFYSGPCHYNSILSKGYDYNSFGRYSMGYNDQRYYNYEGCGAPVKTDEEEFFGTYGDGQSSTGAVDTSDHVNLKEWYSLAYTYNGTVSKLYVNGVLVSVSHTTSAFTKNNNNLFIARNEDPGNPYYFTGVIDEIRIYKRALNANEVSALNSQTNN